MIDEERRVQRSARRHWDEIEIPEAAFLKVRNGAWSRLSSPKAPRTFRLAYACAAGVFALLLVVAFQVWDKEVLPPSEVASLPTSLDRHYGRLEGLVKPEPGAVSASKAIVSNPVEVEKVARQADVRRVASTPEDGGMEKKRLVMNFRLLESGVRMIWIQDSQFGLPEGETDED